MSWSEISDKGASHPWCNLRPYNLTIDGTLLSENVTNLPAQVLSGPAILDVGFLSTPLYTKISGATTTNQSINPSSTVLILNYQTSVNTSTYVRFIANGITQASGGTHPNVTPYQSADWQIVKGATLIFNGGARNNDYYLLTPTPFASGTGGLSGTIGANTVSFAVYDSNAGDIVKWVYSLEVWSVNQ
jgi:hypothetical protein